jgi:hypothetical protein
MVSSYDRAGGNNDAMVGPGGRAISTPSRNWKPRSDPAFLLGAPGGHLRIYIDGNRRRGGYECEEFFSGRHYPFVRPLVGPMGGSNYSYFPIPFAKSIKIQTTALRPAEFPYGVYYQVTYQSFPKGMRCGLWRCRLRAATRRRGGA